MYKIPSKKRPLRINKFLLPKYTKWLHQNYSHDCHHIFPAGRHGKFDNLIIMLPREEHTILHHKTGVTKWTEENGGYEILVPRAMEYFKDYLTSGECDGFEFANYYEMISEIENDPLDAVEVTRLFLMGMDK